MDLLSALSGADLPRCLTTPGNDAKARAFLSEMNKAFGAQPVNVNEQPEQQRPELRFHVVVHASPSTVSVSASFEFRLGRSFALASFCSGAWKRAGGQPAHVAFADAPVAALADVLEAAKVYPNAARYARSVWLAEEHEMWMRFGRVEPLAAHVAVAVAVAAGAGADAVADAVADGFGNLGIA